MALSFVTYGNDPNASPALTVPASEFVSLADAKRQVRREDVNTDDTYIQTILIPAVRERAEQETERQIPLAVWEYRLDRFPYDSCEPIIIPRPPLVSVDRIQYVDTDGVTQTWSSSNYIVDAPVGPRAAKGRVTPAYNQIYPSTRVQINAVTIRFIAGYSVVPPRLKKAMLLDLGTWFENREDQIVGQGYVVNEFPKGAALVYSSFRSR